jgi:hypothetical protein
VGHQGERVVVENSELRKLIGHTGKGQEAYTAHTLENCKRILHVENINKRTFGIV